VGKKDFFLLFQKGFENESSLVFGPAFQHFALSKIDESWLARSKQSLASIRRRHRICLVVTALNKLEYFSVATGTEGEGFVSRDTRRGK
jgi:hypothetical protein